MNKSIFRPASLIGLVFGAVLFSGLTGCVTEPDHRRARVRGPAVQVQTEVILVDDDYVYYPGYEVYYSRNRHRYVYRDGRNWVTRPVPPRVSIEVLLAAPSVRVDFRDSPERHHVDMVRRYPKQWRPSESNQTDDRKDGRNEHRDGDRDEDRRNRD